jgi:hypothetical protein
VAEEKKDDIQFQQYLMQLGIDPKAVSKEQLELIYTDYAMKSKALDRRMDSAQGRANTATPEGRSAGGIYAAANPLEHLAAVGTRIKGGKEVKALEKEEDALANQSKEARQAYGMAMADALRGQQPGAQQPPAPTQPQPYMANSRPVAPQQPPQPQPAPQPSVGPQAAPAMPQPNPATSPQAAAIRGAKTLPPGLPPAMYNLPMQQAPSAPQPLVPGARPPERGAAALPNQTSSYIAHVLRTMGVKDEDWMMR